MKETKFKYSYKALSETERKEVESIKELYEPKTEKEEKFERLKKLNHKVTKTPIIVSLTIGVIGCLIFGLGLAMVLEFNLVVFGVIVAVVGAIPIGLAYFFYRATLEKGKEKYGQEIISLSNELLENEE